MMRVEESRDCPRDSSVAFGQFAGTEYLSTESLSGKVTGIRFWIICP
jgi:hypothetical protein